MKRLTLRSGFKRVSAMGHGNHKKGNITVPPGLEYNAQKVGYLDATIKTMYRNVIVRYSGVRLRAQTPRHITF